MLETVNDALLRSFEGDEFCTMALGVVETEVRRARIMLVLAGHPAPIVLRANGSSRLIGKRGHCWESCRTPSCTRSRS